MDMGSDEGARVKARRVALGYSKVKFAEEVGVNRDTLAAIEAGKGYQAETLAKILRGLDALEAEAGYGAAPRSPAEPSMIEFEVSGDLVGVRVVVRGPVGDMAAMEETVARLVHDIRTKPDDETTTT